MGWWLITAAMAAMTGPRERVSSQFSKHSWVCSVLSTSYVIVHWLLHQSCMAWRSYTTCQGPHEPEVSSGRLLEQQPLQLWLFASCSTGPPPQSPQAPSLLSETSTEWRGPETDLFKQGLCCLSSLSILSESTEPPSVGPPEKVPFHR